MTKEKVEDNKKNKLIERVKKNTTLKEIEIMSESKYFLPKEYVQTELPILNIAFSGQLDGGLVSGLTVLAGKSKSFKTLLGLYCMKAYLEKYPDAIALFYDNEFGTTKSYIEGLPWDRIVHCPIKHMEELKFELSRQLEDIEEGDKVYIFIDSIGNLASKKEIEDALDEKSVSDMQRAKGMKSLFRIITPHLTIKDIPCVAINHVYQSMEMFSSTIISGGCLLAGTKVFEENNKLKNIEDFQEGDLVQTLDGLSVVTHVWNPETLDEGEPECYEIEFEDGYVVTCSENHMFLIENKWVKAKNLLEGVDVKSI